MEKIGTGLLEGFLEQKMDDSLEECTLTDGGEEAVCDFSYIDRVFGSNLPRNQICSIIFMDTLENMPQNAWDVSQRHDRSVMAWTEKQGDGYSLIIGGMGGVNAPFNSNYLFANFTNMKEINFNGCFHTSQVKDMGRMFCGCSSLKYLDVSNFDTSQAIDMRYMFCGCSSLKYLDVSNFDTSQVKDMGRMFCGCSSLKHLDFGVFDTSQTETMEGMFCGCSSLKYLDFSSFDTSRVKNMRDMFDSCRRLEYLDIGAFRTSQVENMGGMFRNCKSLKYLDIRNFNTSQARYMNGMFSGCHSLKYIDVSSFDTSQAKNMSAMFYGCEQMEYIDVSSFDTSQVRSMNRMFCHCKSLKKLDVSNFDTSQVRDMGFMFQDCLALESLDVSGFDMSNVKNMQKMFLGCPFLQGEQELLAQMAKMSEQYEEDVQKKALDFNIFKMAGIQEKEIIMCRVLYGLLEPNGTHGMGMECLKLFLEDVLQLEDLEAGELQTAKIFREYVIPDFARRIDLVIETRYRFLPIEVKIYAEEQEGQCYDYYTFAKGQMAQKMGNKSWKLYYLTLDRRFPSEKSTKGSIECCRSIKPIAWGTDIRQWLEHIKNKAENQNVIEVLKQLIAAILSLSNQNEVGFQRILNELLWQPGNMKSAQLIAKGLEAAKTEFLRNLYYDIKKKQMYFMRIDTWRSILSMSRLQNTIRSGIFQD